jgi:hypothetical protein
MRYADLTTLPSSPDEAKASILDLVTVAIGNNKTEIPMDDILAIMHQQGWDLTRRMVMDILQDNDMVKQITKDKIILQNDNEASPTDELKKDMQKGKNHVDKLAKKAMKKHSR